MSNYSARPTVRILGTHGIPAMYGGFETAAENVAVFLRDQGWRVVVYCQTVGSGVITQDEWRGIERVLVPTPYPGWRGTSHFDLRSIRHACRHRDVCLTFGYNTAVLNILQRLRGIPNVINMDGIEWSRSRWGFFRQAILYSNERIACWVGNRLIADHPEIERYLAGKARSSKLRMITYGAHAVISAPLEPCRRLGLEPGRYFTLICRPIPENTILELVTAFSSRPRSVKLAVFGQYLPESDSYHRAVMDAASDDVVFAGPLYDPRELAAVRFHGMGYFHGHTVGGTNPSLVEAMAAGNAVLAHDNMYNRWVAEDAALYFSDIPEAEAAIDVLIGDPARRAQLASASRLRHLTEFTWERVAGEYETVLNTLTRGEQRVSRFSSTR